MSEKHLIVETEKAIYEIEFGQIEIEITGKCNMNCQHCRASNAKRIDLPVDQIKKILNFARLFSPNYKEVIISGGEPLLHHDIFHVFYILKENGARFITLTTNGALFEKIHLDVIHDLHFDRVVLSVSIDSLNSSMHDSFRDFNGAHELAVKCINMIIKNKKDNIVASIRSTIKPDRIFEMKELANYAYEIGCDRISFSGIHPAGKAIHRSDLWMDKYIKKKFLTEIQHIREMLPRSFKVDTNDPLKCLVFRDQKADIGEKNELVFDGCGAAAITFNVKPDGIMTPCALLDIPMMNIINLSIDEIIENYKNNTMVKNLLDMNLKGKCGYCDRKYTCGGCRARAYIINCDYLAEDPDCWL